MNWEAAPIDPSWITGEPPVTEIAHIANDGTVCAGYWRCTPATFVWYYAVDETIVFLSGIAMIDGSRHEAGSTRTFARGTVAAWTVLETVTKMYVIQSRASFARRVVRKLKSVFA
jgi:uncharacterized protein